MLIIALIIVIHVVIFMNTMYPENKTVLVAFTLKFIAFQAIGFWLGV